MGPGGTGAEPHTHNSSLIYCPNHGTTDFIHNDAELPIDNITSIVTMVICIIGIIFNILNIVIAVRKPSKGSLHIYLVALSIVDGLFLVVILPSRAFRCGDGCTEPPHISAQIYEQFIYLPVANILIVIDIYMTVAWSIHRLVYIYKPRRIGDHSSIPWKATIVATLLSSAIHVPFFLKYEVVNGKIKPTYFTTSNNEWHYTMIVMVVTKVLPILTLLITNILLIRSVKTVISRRRSLTNQQPSQISRDVYNQRRVTCLLVAVICLMVVGNTPVIFSQVSFSVKLFGLNRLCLMHSRKYKIFRALTNVLEALAFALNFLIYYAMNKNFKEFVHQYLTRCCHRRTVPTDSNSTQRFSTNQRY